MNAIDTATARRAEIDSLPLPGYELIEVSAIGYSTGTPIAPDKIGWVRQAAAHIQWVWQEEVDTDSSVHLMWVPQEEWDGLVESGELDRKVGSINFHAEATI